MGRDCTMLRLPIAISISLVRDIAKALGLTPAVQVSDSGDHTALVHEKF